MQGNAKFDECVTRAFNKLVVPTIETHMDEMADRLINHILGLDVTKTNLLPRTKEYNILWLIISGTSEIQEVYESLLDVEIYIRRFPYKGTRVTKPRYLRYIIENYLNQVYVLKQRLKIFLKDIEKLYARGDRRKEVRSITQPLYTFLKNSLNDVVTVRGSSVHEKNFNNNDLKQLISLDFSVRAIDDLSTKAEFTDFYNTQYGRIRLKWIKNIKDLNKKLDNLLNDYYRNLNKVVFDNNDELIIP